MKHESDEIISKTVVGNQTIVVAETPDGKIITKLFVGKVKRKSVPVVEVETTPRSKVVLFGNVAHIEVGDFRL